MSGEWDGLRAAAEAATTPMTCGGHRSMGSLMRCQECLTRANGASDVATAATPAKVLGLLDRLQAAEAAVERVRVVVAELRRPDLSLVGRIMSPSLRTIADALEGHRSGVTGPLGPPQPEVALGSSRGPEGSQGASGAESDHGGRRDGEGLG